MELKDKEIEKKEEEKIKQNKQLKNIFMMIGVIILMFLIGIFTIHSIRNFEYQGVDFKTEKFGEIIVYRTTFPIYSITGKHAADYNIYIRNDPRKLENIPFEGELHLLKNMVINSTKDFKCEGRGVIALANLVTTLEELSEITIVKNETLSCDPQGRYMFVQLQEGDETSIEQFGPVCYNLNVNNCEILEVTERFLVESIIKFHK